MSIAFNVAVIMHRNRSLQAPPAVADVRRYLLDDRFSVARFWRDATYGWVTFPRMDFLGWFDVSLPDGTSRSDAIEAAKPALMGTGSTFLPTISLRHLPHRRLRRGPRLRRLRPPPPQSTRLTRTTL
jgi:hypothetical protein